MFSEWFHQLQWNVLLEPLVAVVASVLCITIHETSHGLAAYWMGDDTAKRAGRLTLNPLHHIDLVGLVMMAVVHFGWAKPVPIDMRRFKKQKLGMVLTALAGPVSNFLLAFVAMLVLYCLAYLAHWIAFPDWFSYVLMLLSYITQISITLGTFNLLPIPPLDGSKVFFSFLPDSAYKILMRYERYGFLVLSSLLLLNILGKPLSLLVSFSFDLLSQGASWIVYSIMQLIM